MFIQTDDVLLVAEDVVGDDLLGAGGEKGDQVRQGNRNLDTEHELGDGDRTGGGQQGDQHRTRD